MAERMTLTEHAIRPKDTAAEQKRRYLLDLEKLLTRKAEFVDAPCPACGGEERALAFEKHTLCYQRCAACATVYIAPRPTPEILAEYYASSLNYAYWNEVIFPASEAVRRARIFRPRVERVIDLCERHGIARGTLLEVGAGFGTFLEELRAAKGFAKTIGIEPTPPLAETCRKRGLSIIEAPVEQAVVGERVDVIASFEVIEHLFRPADFVAACARLLAPGGLLVLTCPNILGFDITVLGPGSPAIDFEHLNYFHPRSLGLLLQQHGLTVLESSTPGKLDADIVRNRVLDGEATLTDPFFRRVLIDEWSTLGEPFQRFLSENGLSSNMWIAARRSV
jgi:2-polyprenyl-3-methyl-5-hydroxy-6-metoxy-1,4-benzoquinol methylase